MPLSFETKAAEDAEVPDLVGVCLVQLTQLLGGGTAVRASGIGTGTFRGRAIGGAQDQESCYARHVTGGIGVQHRPEHLLHVLTPQTPAAPYARYGPLAAFS